MAQTPTYQFNGTGGSCNVFPLGNTSTNMVQWIYQPSQFTPTLPTAAVNITQIYLKTCNSSTGATYSNLQVKMGTTTLTGLTSGPWNTGLTTVYFSTSASIPAWTSGGWIVITLQTPFFYPGGNFLVEVSQTGYTGTGANMDQNSSLAGGRMWGSVTSTSSSGAGTGQVVFGFDAVPAACSGTPSIPTISTAPFPASTPLCAGSTTTINAINPNLGTGISTMWQSSTSAAGPWSNVTSGTGATTLSYTTGPITANTYFRIGVTCANSSITSYSNPFLVPVGSPQPAIITGPSTYCPGDPATYSVTFVPGTTYAWTLPTGWSGFSSSNSITVTPSAPGTSPGTLSVTATSSCGPASIPSSRTIVPGSAPGPPGTITGNNFICSGTTQTYSVVPVGGALSYVWTLPSGWSGTSTTNSITTTTNATGGNVTVRAINGCGSSSLTSLPVTIISSLPNPGRITGKDTVCSGSLQTYSVVPVPGATSYTWTLPSGWSGTTTGTSIQAFAGSSTGVLRVTAQVSCALSPSSDTTIVVRTTVSPSLTISTPATTLCQGSPITITATPSFPGNNPTYTWRRNGLPVSAFGTTYTTNTLAKGDSISVTMTSNAVCAANTVAVSNTLYPNITPSVVPGVSINTVPPINLCAGTPVTFTSSSAGTGSAPTYQWYKNGAAISGATGTTYTDPSLVNGDTVTIRMTTTAVCATMPVATSNKVGVRVMDKQAPSVSISVSPSEEVSSGQELTFTATHSHGGATPDYQWFKNGVIIPFETGSTFSSSTLQSGDHISVRMLSYETCVTTPLATSNIIVLKSSSLGVGSGNGAVAVSGPELSLYPNPSSGRVHVSVSGWPAAYSGSQVRVDVLSAVGQVVYHMELSPTVSSMGSGSGSGSGSGWKTQVDLGAELADGRYMLRVSTADGSYKATLPFILNR